MIQMEMKRLNYDGKVKIEHQEADLWLIVTTNEVVIEIMTEETRDNANLESFWVLKDFKTNVDKKEI